MIKNTRKNYYIVYVSFLALSILLIARPNLAPNPQQNSTSIAKSVTTGDKQVNGNSLKWEIVSSRTHITFKVKHFVLMEVEGKLRGARGVVETSGVRNFSNAKLVVEIPVATINTGNEDRDIHLKTKDFFNVEKYPLMKFQSLKVTKIEEESYELSGTLTIRDVSKPITLLVKQVESKTNSKGNIISKFIATGSLNRYDYGLSWNELTETGSMVVGKDVQLELNVTLEKSV